MGPAGEGRGRRAPVPCLGGLAGLVGGWESTSGDSNSDVGRAGGPPFRRRLSACPRGILPSRRMHEEDTPDRPAGTFSSSDQITGCRSQPQKITIGMVQGHSGRLKIFLIRGNTRAFVYKTTIQAFVCGKTSTPHRQSSSIRHHELLATD